MMMTKRKLIENGAYFKFTYDSRAFEVCEIYGCNEEGYLSDSKNNPDGEYYIIETDSTNNYGYHDGRQSSFNIREKSSVDKFIYTDSSVGHVRITAKVNIENGEVKITKFEKILLDREGN